MDTVTQQFYAVLFADLSGSARLYDEQGDDKANHILQALLERTITLVKRYGGSLIKQMGDEVLCCFPTAEQAVTASIALQEKLLDTTQQHSPLSLRIGIHWGPVTVEKGTLMGSTVSMAAHMSAIARAGEIITTKETIKALPERLQEKAHLLNNTHFSNQHEILSIQWQKLPASKPSSLQKAAPAATPTLSLRYLDQHHLVFAGETATIGRADDCHISVISALASRVHGLIESRGDQFFYIDQSTNGSYIKTSQGVSYVRRSEALIAEATEIAIGGRFEDRDVCVVGVSP